MADFSSENMPNQILCSCLKANTNIPDELILDAFNEAYPICIDVLTHPELHIARSEDFTRIASNASRSSLLAYCFVYFLLSFTEKAEELQPYLSNLKELLLDRMPDIFKPIMLSASSIAPMLPGSVIFDLPQAAAMPEPQALNDTKQFVKIQTLMRKAAELPKDDHIKALKLIRSTVAEESGNWDQILSMAIDQAIERPDVDIPRSPYKISYRQLTSFVKLARVIYELKIFEKHDGGKLTNAEDFVTNLCSYFNTEIANVRSVLSSAKQTENFLDIFDQLRDKAVIYYSKGLDLDNHSGKPTINKRPSNIEIDFK